MAATGVCARAMGIDKQHRSSICEPIGPNTIPCCPHLIPQLCPLALTPARSSLLTPTASLAHDPLDRTWLHHCLDAALWKISE